MIGRIGRYLACAATLVLGGCASAPLHYYTLVAPDGAAHGTAAAPPGAAAAMPFDLLPVGVPPQVDQPQLVVRDGAQRVLLLNNERWIAPLGDELRSALSADLAAALQSKDASGLPDAGSPRLRIKLDVRRFESQLDGYALITGTWMVRALHTGQDAALTCTSSVREPVAAGYAALVQGHQQALAALAAQIAAVARALGAGQPAACPET